MRCLSDNLLIRELLQTKTEGMYWWLTGPATEDARQSDALSPSMAGIMAGQWAIILGAVRDVRATFTLDCAVKALGSNPRKSEKRGTGCIDEVVSFGV